MLIGGEGETFSPIVSNTERRNQFVESVTDFVLKYKFDGLDLDWEYPTQRLANSILHLFNTWLSYIFFFKFLEVVLHLIGKILCCYWRSWRKASSYTIFCWHQHWVRRNILLIKRMMFLLFLNILTICTLCKYYPTMKYKYEINLSTYAGAMIMVVHGMDILLQIHH